MTTNDTDKIPTWVGRQLVAINKVEAHRKGLLHKGVAVFVICKGHMLIHQRAENKFHSPALWASACYAHPRWDEPAETCAHRRLYEDMGLRDLDLIHRDTLQYRAKLNEGMIEHEVADIFATTVPVRPVMSPNPRDVMDTRWENIPDLVQQAQNDPSSYTPLMQIYLRDHVGQMAS
ncbi:MAG: isopentenyl-diphosphate Delta-isomerase [Roseovarius sp.]